MAWRPLGSSVTELVAPVHYGSRKPGRGALVYFKRLAPTDTPCPDVALPELLSRRGKCSSEIVAHREDCCRTPTQLTIRDSGLFSCPFFPRLSPHPSLFRFLMYGS